MGSGISTSMVTRIAYMIITVAAVAALAGQGPALAPTPAPQLHVDGFDPPLPTCLCKCEPHECHSCGFHEWALLVVVIAELLVAGAYLLHHHFRSTKPATTLPIPPPAPTLPIPPPAPTLPIPPPTSLHLMSGLRATTLKKM